MKKHSLEILDNIFWYLIYALPFLWYGIAFLSRNYTPVSLGSFFDFVGFDVSSSITFTTLAELFGSSGILPLFDNPVVIQIFAWFVNCMIIHLAVDFLSFIPRLCHKFMDKLCQND